MVGIFLHIISTVLVDGPGNRVEHELLSGDQVTENWLPEVLPSRHHFWASTHDCGGCSTED